MYRWSKIPDEHRPEIISDISNDDRFLTFIVQDWKFRKILRKDVGITALLHPAAAFATFSRSCNVETTNNTAIRVVNVAWDGYCFHSQAFRNIIDKNIPCILMHKVKNIWAPEIDTVVCFMTGDTLDVFLVHPKDLTEWDPNEEVNNV